MHMSLAAFAAKGRFWRGNLHTHSTVSDGVRPPSAVVEFYADAGYDFLALTDHFWESCGYPVTDTRPFRSNRFTTLLGAEIHAPVTSKGEAWHVVVVGLPLGFEPWRSGETIQAMCRRASGAGAFLGIAHPQWYGLTVEDAMSLPEAHAVEIYNYGCALECDRGDGLVLLEEMLAQGRRIHAYAADDAHFRLPDAGGAWVMVKTEALEPGLLLEALKRGDFYSSQGPEIYDISVNGGQVTVACSPSSWIVAAGMGTSSRCAHGQDLTCATLPVDGFDSGYFRISIADDRGRRAWSNPIWQADAQ
jgi:hypothetical protein